MIRPVQLVVFIACCILVLLGLCRKICFKLRRNIVSLLLHFCIKNYIIFGVSSTSCCLHEKDHCTFFDVFIALLTYSSRSRNKLLEGTTEKSFEIIFKLASVSGTLKNVPGGRTQEELIPFAEPGTCPRVNI
jgi:hypothetical protein